ncbi:MAG: hypothetical protein HUU60_03955 [Armatimonadetes bacterium]|nr:hypothetical protein [Armatimonadota bacterium]
MRRVLWIGLLGLAASSVVSQAQNASAISLYGDQGKSTAVASNEVGVASSDLLPGNGTRAGYTLRYAPIIPGSESVYIDGRRLKRDADYFLDRDSGTIAFAEPVRRSSSVTIHYRYSKNGQATNGAKNLSLIALSFGNSGGISALMATTPTEQAADGSVWQSQAFGLAQKLGIGQGAQWDGLFFMGSRRQLQAYAAPHEADAKSPVQTGGSQERFVSQKFAYDRGGLKLSVNYQDIGAGFSAAKMLGGQSGLDAAQVGQWDKEKGIRRFGLGFGMDLGHGASLKQDFSRITDSKGSIETRSLQFDSKSLGFYWNDRRADASFARFNDLAEQQRGDWAREKGISRTGMGGRIGLGAGELKFDQSAIEEGGASISRQNLSLGLGQLKFSAFNQEIGKEFKRFDHLAEGEKGQWAREKGLKREGWNLGWGAEGGKANFLSINQSRIGQGEAGFERQNFRIGGNGWTASHMHREADSEFKRLNDLAPGELNELALEVKSFYDPKANAINDQERQQAAKELGLSRDMQRFGASLGKNGRVEWSRSAIKDAMGGDLQQDRLSYASPNFAFNYLTRSIDQEFKRMGDLAPIERALFHNERGIGRTQWDGTIQLGNASLYAAQTDADAAKGGFHRESYKIALPKFEAAFNRRSVDAEFARSGDLAEQEGERKLLGALRGSNQQDLTIKTALIAGIGAELFHYGASNAEQKTRTNRLRGGLTWNPDKLTQLSFNGDRFDENDPERPLLFDHYAKSAMERNLGFGQLTAFTESRETGGAIGRPVEKKTDYYKFVSQNWRSLNLTVESRDTKAEGDVSEDYDYLNAQYQINKSAKVTMAEARAMREGAPDEIVRESKIEWTLKPGSTVSFSETRRLVEGQKGHRALSASLTQTAFAGLAFSGTYIEQRVDNQSVKSQSDFGLKTVKPIDFLFLNNAEFSFTFNSLADKGAWHKEQKGFQFKANWGTSLLEANYAGVFVPGKGRAADRTFKFASNGDPKLPYHLSASYKIRTMPDGAQHQIRNYHLDYKLNDRLTLVHDFVSYPEQARGDVVLGSIVQATGFSNWTLQSTISSRLGLKGEYRTEWHDQQRKKTRKGGLSLVGKAFDQANFEFGYRLESESIGADKRTAHTFRVAFDHKLSADKFIVLGLESAFYEHRKDGSARQNLRGSLEFKTLF